ncbi:hypothetical protein F2P56_032671 [Juglans regia]|uniref:Uncharacterized protein n=3 Tax=Juglans regia TaxID=51240 RepID=A0A833TG29_JUGRE|nr:uncharacterized protein LOC108989642 isoform X1 [Juglans regia]KAF5447096.1 hypothetical protein F2P56_032671 [Juglans regia]KAF5447097.1 hypothetical protein F2P56_032671 [Juglans regia]
MDSDLSLLEITGEDDSLLLQIPKDDASTLNNNNYFYCSPLQISRSKRPVALPPRFPPIAEGKVAVQDGEKPIPSLQTDIISEANINANQSEMPKLCMEPQQMKRRKKGGGYNLRKSLAWDRAFFTEEGVLNPLELSMISGSFSKAGGEILSDIPEEGRESLSSELEGTRDSPDLQAIEENLFKESLTSSLNKDRKSDCCVLLKHGSPSADKPAPDTVGKKKVLSSNDANKSGSKRSGCPRSVAPSSLKRPAVVNTNKAATKASKVSKIPVPKPGLGALSRTTNGAALGASDSKHNQIAQLVNVQRKNGSKASDKIRSAQSKPKASLANKSLTAGTSIRQSRRNVVNSASEKILSTNLPHSPVTKTNNGFGVILDPLPNTSNTTNSHNCGGAKTAVSLFQNACYTGGNMQHAQPQITKPSGLRMPSPSLGFFGQPKVASLTPGQRSSQPHNLFKSNIPNLRKPVAINYIRDPRPPAHPDKFSNVINNATTNGTMKVLSSTLGCSVPVTIHPASQNRQDEKITSVTKVNNEQKVVMEVPFDDCKRDKVMKDEQQLHGILDDADQQVLEHAEPYKTEMVFQKEYIKLQSIDKKFLKQGETSGQSEKSDDNKVTDVCTRKPDLSLTELEKHHSMSCLSFPVQDNGASGTNDLIVHQVVDDKLYNLAIKNNDAFSGSESADASCYSTQSTSKANDDWLSSAHNAKEQSGNQAKLTKHFTCKDDKNSSQRLWANNCDFLEDSGASKEFQTFNCIADVNPKVQDSSETELEQAKDDASRDGKMSRKSLRDARAESLDGDVSNENLSTFTADNKLLMVDEVHTSFGEQLDTPQSLEAVVLEASGSCESKSRRWSILCLRSPAIQDCSDEVAKTVECQRLLDSPSVSLDSKDRKPVVEYRSSSIDTQFRHDLQLCGQVTSLELDMMGEDHTTGNGCPKSGDFSGTEFENPHLSCHLSHAVQVKDGSGIDDVVQQEDVEEKKFNLSAKIPHAISDFQPGDDIGGIHQNTSEAYVDLRSGKHNVKQKSGEQAKLILACPCEADTISYKENHSPDTYHSLLFEESQSFEGSMKFNCRTVADNLKVQGSSGSGLENPYDLSQHRYADQAIEEVDGPNDMFKEPNIVQSPDGRIFVSSWNSNASPSAAKNQHLVVVDDTNEQFSHPRSQNSLSLVEQVSQDNYFGLCLKEDLAPANTTPKELKKEIVFESGLEQSEVYGSYSKSSNLLSQVTSSQDDGLDADHRAECLHVEDALTGSLQDDGLNADHNAECLHVEDAVTGSVAIGPLVEKLDDCSDTNLRHDSGLIVQASSLEFDSSRKMSTDEISGAVDTGSSNAFYSLRHESGLSVIIDQGSKNGNVLKSGSLLGEVETNLAHACEMPQELDKDMYPSGNRDATIQLMKPENDMKQEAHVVVKPPTHVVPFSDEWLAAIEAAGEEILTRKSGAVQNSPPDKSQPEPGPWSPVRRKNTQGVGPFDCTKYTNIPPSGSQ